MGTKGIKVLTNTLKFNKVIREVNFAGNHVLILDLDYISGFVSKCKTLKSINLSYTGFEDLGVKKIFKALEGGFGLTELILNNDKS